LIAFLLCAELTRLVGQMVAPGPAGCELLDVAGEGRPLIGTVERRGAELWLVGEVSLRLEGPLATPRIAGPGHRVWVLGARAGEVLRARRLGVLARPPAATPVRTPP
jgi:hypothetical protein